jgi:two-component system cell cycle sensor histidine kinase/response regulator CckA
MSNDKAPVSTSGDQRRIDAWRRLAAIVESSSDAIIGKTPDGTIVSWNPAAERIYGYSSDEAIGRPVAMLVPEDRQEELEEILERLRAGERVESFETTRVAKDGRVIDVSLTISPIPDEDGAIVGSSTIARDVSSRKRREAELLATEARVRAMLEASLDAIVTIDERGKILEFNAAAESMFGHTRDEVIGREMAPLLIPPSLREAHRLGFERFLANGDGRILRRRLELTGLRADGAEFPIELTVVPIRLHHGTIFTASIRDITARLDSEAALRRSEERYRLLFERHPAPLWLFDPETLRFLAVNEAAIETYGYSRQEFLAMTIEDIRPPEDRGALRETIRGLGDERSESGLWRHQRKGGALLDVSIVSDAVEVDGRRVRLVLAQDVTERRRLEEQLSRAQKMEAIGSLAGGVAHDFNNLLTIIRACGAVLLKRLDDDALREPVRQIEDAATRAAGLTRQLLTVGRQQLLRPEVTNVNAIVDETLALLERVIGEDVEIVRDLEREPRPILVDPGQLSQVILNLCVNARDAMPDGGRLTIRTANVELDASYAATHVDVTAGPQVLLQVTDTGAGMDEATRARVFDPFFTTKETGTGLGLATVYGIVAQTGGHIWVYSEPGLGTTFKLYFPLAAQAVEPPAAPSEVTSLAGSETILLVEDAEPIRGLVAGELREHGYSVIEAGDGEEALQIALAHDGDIDLLVTDMVMPRMNGRELADRLTRDSPTLKVLFTSGYPEDRVVERAIAQGAIAFIEKPFLPDDVARKIRELL